jgi:hypothetical protein
MEVDRGAGGRRGTVTRRLQQSRWCEWRHRGRMEEANESDDRAADAFEPAFGGAS